MLDQRTTTLAQMKWLPKLMGYDYEIAYKKGDENVMADALSRVQQDFIDGLHISRGRTVIMVIVLERVVYKTTSLATHFNCYGQTEVVNSYHTAIKTTPFQAVYGQLPPTHISYNKRDSMVKAVDTSLVARESIIQLLKFHIKRAQDKMKSLANKSRSERDFELETWAYLLQPYRQVTIRQGKHHKLSPKYFGPFKIIQKIGKYKGPTLMVSGQLSNISNEGLIIEEPFVVLDRRMAKRGNVAAAYVLIQWGNGSADATWELYEDIAVRFPHFDLNQ
ncbi:hypothetical protein Tco_1428201 [Tanacetum coccineum]